MFALRRGSNSLLARGWLLPSSLHGCSHSSIRNISVATQLHVTLFSDCFRSPAPASFTYSTNRGVLAVYSAAEEAATHSSSWWRCTAHAANALSWDVLAVVQEWMDWAVWLMSSTLKKRRKKMNRHKWKKRQKTKRRKTK